MDPLQWDRLLETCYRRDATDILLVPGSPPMLRLTDDWRELQIPPLDPAAVHALAAELVGKNGSVPADGYVYSDFRYGDVARFRLMAFGYPHGSCSSCAGRHNAPKTTANACKQKGRARKTGRGLKSIPQDKPNSLSSPSPAAAAQSPAASTASASAPSPA